MAFKFPSIELTLNLSNVNHDPLHENSPKLVQMIATTMSKSLQSFKAMPSFLTEIRGEGAGKVLQEQRCRPNIERIMLFLSLGQSITESCTCNPPHNVMGCCRIILSCFHWILFLLPHLSSIKLLVTLAPPNWPLMTI